MDIRVWLSLLIFRLEIPSTIRVVRQAKKRVDMNLVDNKNADALQSQAWRNQRPSEDRMEKAYSLWFTASVLLFLAVLLIIDPEPLLVAVRGLAG